MDIVIRLKSQMKQRSIKIEKIKDRIFLKGWRINNTVIKGEEK